MNAAFGSARRASGARLVVWALRLLLCGLVLLSFQREAHAYAWMVKRGYAKCSSCHTDPSGGETLTHMGRVQSQLLLSQLWGDEPELTTQATLLNGLEEPNAIRLGGSFRYMNIYSLETDTAGAEFNSFPMQMDVYGWGDLGLIQFGGSIGLGNVDVGDAHMRAAQITSGEGMVPLSRNHWLGVELTDDALLRAGRLNLPFGVRIPEHVAWVREATRTDRESDQQHGLALAYTGGSVRTEFMLVAGNYQISPDQFRERGYAGYFEYLLSNRAAIGLSSMILQSRSGPYFNPIGTKVLRHAHGVTGRIGASEELSFLAEVDVLKTSGQEMGFTGFLQGDYELIQGLHLIGTFEGLDSGAIEGAVATSPGAGEMLFGVWGGINWFFCTHFDLRVEAVYRQESATSFQSQLHYYF